MNKGFTLMELLASIIIIGLLLIITIPSYIYIMNTSNETNYNNKMNSIKIESLKYGEKIKDEIQASTCKNVSIAELIQKGYLKSDYKTQDALKNPYTNQPFEEKLSICYCSSNNELKAFYLDSFDYTKSYIKGSQVKYNEMIYESVVSYDYFAIVNDIGDTDHPAQKRTIKWNNSGDAVSTCTGYYNEELNLCISNASTLNPNYVLSNFFKKIEC